jgi:GTPase SAR1 family protein
MSAPPGKTLRPGLQDKALVKIIVLGCANVGKTSIMERLVSSLDWDNGMAAM